MKVTRSSGARPPALDKVVGLGGAKGKSFAAKLARSERAEAAAASTPAARPRPISAVADLGAALEAGKLTAEAAIDQVVARVVERQLGKTGSPAARARLEAALRASLADDPLLAAKVRALSHD